MSGMGKATSAALRARILATANPKPVAVEVEAWGIVYVKPLTVADLDAAETEQDPKLANARGLAKVLCDEEGVLLFDPNSADDLFALMRLKLSDVTVLHAAINATREKPGNVAAPVVASADPAQAASASASS